MRRANAVLSVVMAGSLSASGMLARAQGAGLKLEVRTADGQKEYRVGERIPLELNFTGPGDGRYEVSQASYDRSGRMAYEEFEVEPGTGWADPLKKFYESSGGMLRGGLYSAVALSARPVKVKIDLSEWVRFDRPGDYSVVVVSRRILDMPEGGVASFDREDGVVLRSNALQVKIVPATAEWQEKKLDRIVAALAATSQEDEGGNQSERRTAAIADLRFPGTQEAIALMSEHLQHEADPLSFACMLGLVGLQAQMRTAAIADLEKRIANPKFTVSSLLVDTLAALQLNDADPEQEREERNQLRGKVWEQVLQALPGKVGKARAETAAMLLERPPEWVTPESRAELGLILGLGFSDLSEQKQTAELLENWNALRSDALLPMLEGLAKAPLKSLVSDDGSSQVKEALKSVSLSRWYELDPAGAREEALKDVGSSHPSLRADDLDFLPAEPMPQFEGIWANGFARARDSEMETVFAELLARFGTGSEVEAVREKAEVKAGKWACKTQGAALGYLVKFDPESARPLIERVIQQGGADRADDASECSGTVFQDISAYATGSVMRELAIAALDSEHADVTSSAVIYLTSFGDKTAREPIWKRYLRWSEKWHGREAELEDYSTDRWPESNLGINLGSALIANQSWLADPGLISGVLARCVGGEMCTQLKEIVGQVRTEPYIVSAYGSGRARRFELAQYSPMSIDLLEEKIAQFPRGTRFALAKMMLDQVEQGQLEEELKPIFEKKGMTLVRAKDDQPE